MRSSPGLISGSVDQWISGGRCSHGGAEARRKQREESTTGHKGNWRVSCSCLCVETPVVAHRCFALPWSSILCGCINIPGRQVNAVWSRCPTACTMYATKKLGVCVLGARRQNLSRLRVEKLGCAVVEVLVMSFLFPSPKINPQTRPAPPPCGVGSVYVNWTSKIIPNRCAWAWAVIQVLYDLPS
jgi:hypothetical protein